MESPEEALAFVRAIKEDLLGSGYALVVTNRRIAGIKVGGAANAFGGSTMWFGALGALGTWIVDPMRKSLAIGDQDLDELISQKKGSWVVSFDEIEKLTVEKTMLDRKLRIKSKKQKATYRGISSKDFDRLKEVLPSLPLGGKLVIF